jgi:putative ABC transport system permease protein
MPIGPIFSTLRHHRTAALLIVLEFALTFAIVCNAVFLIGERVSRMQRPSGIAEAELLRIEVAAYSDEENADALMQEDIATLSAIPGVRRVASSLWLPFGHGQRQSGVSVVPDPLDRGLNVTRYPGSRGLLETLGVQLTAGRDFTPEEYVDEQAMRRAPGGPVIITRAVADRLWPGQNALGRSLYITARYMDNHPLQVVGIIERLVRPAEPYGPSNYEHSVLLPVREGSSMYNYVLRVDPDRRGEVLTAAVSALEKSAHGRIVQDHQTVEEMRAEYYRADRAMAWLLVSVCAALLIVTALGIVGLASFWVQQRTRQIGIRRALGATRRQILQYFQAENFVLATLGIALGIAFAYGINLLLMDHYELGRLPAPVLAIGALALWLLGQLAVLGPALRAAAVPPAVATRSV